MTIAEWLTVSTKQDAELDPSHKCTTIRIESRNSIHVREIDRKSIEIDIVGEGEFVELVEALELSKRLLKEK